jgi:beta-N-acetylhexosaminidase
MRTPTPRWYLALAAAVASLGVAACSPTATWQAGASPSASGPGGSATTVPPATTTPPAPPPVSQEDSCVNNTLSEMGLNQIVGQVMLVGTPIGSPANANNLVHQYGLGGVFLQGRSAASASSLRSAISALQNAGGGHLFISLDQEGGEVQTLQGSDFPPIPTAVDQGQLSQTDLRSQTVAWAQRLAGIGVNLDLAPVADTVPASLGTGNPPIGAFDRQYGSDPTAVGVDITTVVGSIQSTGVMTTIKHFPGLGRVTANTDTSTGAVDSTATAQDPYLAPFAAGIQAGTGAVMVSLALYPKLDPNAVAAFSQPIVTGLLRQQLGFKGMIVSDDLGNAVAVSNVPVGQRAVRFIQAGGDLALAVSIDTATPMLAGLVSQAKASASFAAQLTAAASHVLHAKYGAGLLPCSPKKP